MGSKPLQETGEVSGAGRNDRTTAGDRGGLNDFAGLRAPRNKIPPKGNTRITWLPF